MVWGSGLIDVVGGSGVGREPIENVIAIGIVVEVAVVAERVRLKVSKPVVHDFELPFSFGVVDYSAVDTRVVTGRERRIVDTAGSIACNRDPRERLQQRITRHKPNLRSQVSHSSTTRIEDQNWNMRCCPSLK